MDIIEAIMTRNSVRDFTNQNISDGDLRIILKAGMSGPSCANTRDWVFIVVKDKDMLNEMANANGKPADPLRNANVGILICGDLDRAFKNAKDYWIIDGSIAAQNMTIAAHALGLGSVWLGTYPQLDRVSNQSKLFKLPDTLVPHSVLAFGYADDKAAINADRPKREKIEYEEDRVHFEKW